MVYPLVASTENSLLAPCVTVTFPCGVMLPPTLEVVAIVHVWIVALQVEVVPPLTPMHVQLHGPVPVTTDAVPEVQKLAVGAVVKVPPLLVPHAPLTGVGGIRLKVAAIV